MLKKCLSFGLMILLTICMGMGFVGCFSDGADTDDLAALLLGYDPKGKVWYNGSELPSIDEPFRAVYDGCYSVQIDEDGNVLFRPLNGETIVGKLSTETQNFRTKVSILFENGKLATGSCSKQNFSFLYERKNYRFYDSIQTTKEEFDEYLSQFIAFLTNVYETGNYPTAEEIAADRLYRAFTNYHQTDPCCGGPIVYEIVERATIESIEKVDYGTKMTVTLNGERVDCVLSDDCDIARVANGAIEELSVDDITPGECLINIENSVFTIFYMDV